MNIISGKKKYEKGVEHVIDRARIHKDEEKQKLKSININERVHNGLCGDYPQLMKQYHQRIY